MKMYLTAISGGTHYQATRLIDVHTSGDFFKQLFIHHESWNPELSLWLTSPDETVFIGNLQNLYDMPLIELCRKVAPHYVINRARAERVLRAANRIGGGVVWNEIEVNTDFWR